MFHEVINLKIPSTTVGAVRDNARLPLSKLDEKCTGEHHSGSPNVMNILNVAWQVFISPFSAPQEPSDWDSVQSKLAFFFFSWMF